MIGKDLPATATLRSVPEDHTTSPARRSVRPQPGELPGHEAASSRTRLTPLRLLLGVIVAVMIAMWAYAFSPLARRPAPDTMTNPAVAQRSEEICKKAAEVLSALPKAGDTADPTARADVVNQSNAILARMLDDLDAVVASPGGARSKQLSNNPGQTDADHDAGLFREWLADWRTYLADRTDYASRLRGDSSARLFVTQKGARQVTEPIDGFASSNKMASCASPGDIF